MAVNLGELTSVVEDSYIKGLRNNVFEARPYIKSLRKKQVLKSGGEKVRIPIITDSTYDGPYDKYDTLPSDHVCELDAARYTWVRYQQSIVLENWDVLCSQGPTALLNLVEEKTEVARMKLSKGMSKGAWSNGSVTGDDGTHFGGLQLLVNTSNTTVGEIVQGTYTWFVPQRDGTTTALSLKSLMDLWNECTEFGETPTDIWTGKTTYAVLENILDAGQRYVNTNKADGGFTTLTFHGIPVHWDTDCPSTSTIDDLYMLNSNQLKLYTHKKRDFKLRKFMEPEDEDAIIGRVQYMGQMGTGMPAAHGVMYALAS